MKFSTLPNCPPFKVTGSLKAEEIERLWTNTKETLQAWIERLRTQTGTGFPERVTAFRPEMNVHGKYRKPCPVYDSPVQRVVYADNEANYSATCQTGGKLLKDRALSRLLKSDWPRSIDEMEELRTRQNEGTGAKLSEFMKGISADKKT